MMFSKCYSIAKFRVFSAVIIGVVFGLTGWVISTGIVLAQEIVSVNKVMVVPQGIGENLKVEKGNQCKKDMHPGCLRFRRGELGYIVFHLPGSKNKVKNCSDVENEFVITKIEVTATGADDDTSVYKGDFNAAVPDWLQEAFPAIDPATGIIYKAPWNVARTQEWVSNLNNHENPPDGLGVVKSFWYKVTVTACAENEEGTHTIWVSDPRGDNEGTK